MKKIKQLLAIIIIAAIPVSLFAQTADEVVNKYIDAIGGKEALSKVNSLYIENEMEVMGNSAPAKVYVINGKGYKSEMDFNGQSIVQCITNDGGWLINPFMGGTDAQAMPDEQFKANKSSIYIGGALYDYASKGNKVELEDKDGDDFVVKLTTPDSVETTFYISGKDYTISKSISKGDFQGQQVDVVVSYSNYQKTDAGYLMPYTTNIDMGGFGFTSNVKKVEVNKEIDPKIFDMPK